MVIDKPLILMYTNLASGREISIIQAGKVRGSSATTAIAVIKQRIFVRAAMLFSRKACRMFNAIGYFLILLREHIPWANGGKKPSGRYTHARFASLRPKSVKGFSFYSECLRQTKKEKETKNEENFINRTDSRDALRSRVLRRDGRRAGRRDLRH